MALDRRSRVPEGIR